MSDTILTSNAVSSIPLRYAISIVYYGRGDPALNDDPSHVGIGVHPDIHAPSTCHLHHIRCPSQTRYIYDPRPKQPLASDPVLWGQCIIARDMSDVDATSVNNLLENFGQDEANLPVWNEGNCQNWMMEAIGMLERYDMIAKGEREFWAALIGQGAQEAHRRCAASGKVWIAYEKRRPTNVDARWGGDTSEKVGKLSHNSTLKSRMQDLETLMVSKQPAKSQNPRNDTDLRY